VGCGPAQSPRRCTKCISLPINGQCTNYLLHIVRRGTIITCASEEVLFALIKSKCLPVLFYGTEARPITSADKHSLEFTMNKVLYKIFGAMSKESYGEICKYFGIDKVEESIRHRQEKIVKRYSGYSNWLCHSIFARL